MNCKLFNILVGLSIFLGLALSCKDKPKNGRTDTYSSGTIRFVADESFSPIIDEEVEVFESIYRNAKVIPHYTNELDAVNMLMKGETLLAVTSRNFTKKEVDNLKARKFLPVATPLAYDGLTLIVNNSRQYHFRTGFQEDSAGQTKQMERPQPPIQTRRHRGSVRQQTIKHGTLLC